jgi:hypothetical protein
MCAACLGEVNRLLFDACTADCQCDQRVPVGEGVMQLVPGITVNCRICPYVSECLPIYCHFAGLIKYAGMHVRTCLCLIRPPVDGSQLNCRTTCSGSQSWWCACRLPSLRPRFALLPMQGASRCVMWLAMCVATPDVVTARSHLWLHICVDTRHVFCMLKRYRTCLGREPQRLLARTSAAASEQQ